MGYKFFIFLFFLILFSQALVSANLTPSTGKLFFNFEKMEKQCQNIQLTSEDYNGAVNIRDIWSLNDQSKNIKEFLLNSSQLGLTVAYSNEIKEFNGNTNVDLCITPNQNGLARGVIIFTPNSDTNIVVETGVWLFVNVSGSSSYMNYNIEKEETKQPQIIENTTNEQKGLITGSVVQNNGNSNINVKTISIALIVVAIMAVLIMFYFKREKKAEWER